MTRLTAAKIAVIDPAKAASSTIFEGAVLARVILEY
jgi:hypothetical protein